MPVLGGSDAPIDSNQNGQDLNLISGAAGGTSQILQPQSGHVNIVTADSFSAGDILLQAGLSTDVTSGGGPGGNITLTAGSTLNDGAGGYVIISPGGSNSGPAGGIVLNFLPTADPHHRGQVWNSSGTLMVSAG